MNVLLLDEDANEMDDIVCGALIIDVDNSSFEIAPIAEGIRITEVNSRTLATTDSRRDALSVITAFEG